MSNDSYRRLVADASAVPRPTPLAGMPSVLTWVALAAAAALVVLSLLGSWSVTAWWSALVDWAPISVVVTLAGILGWQLQLTHTALGALQQVRTGDDRSGRRRRAVVLAVTWLVCLAWFGGTVLLPGT